MGQEILSLKNISFSYDNQIALKDINFCVKENDFIGIIGPNGGGKTTLLKLILGILKPQTGEIKFGGQDILKNPLRYFVGYVPQVTLFDKNFPLSVIEAVLMGRLSHSKILKNYTRQDYDSALNALKMVDIIDLKDKQVGSLSEGQKKRVFIARALASLDNSMTDKSDIRHSKLMLLDEPTASVDSFMQKGVYELLLNLKKSMAIVLVTHDIGVLSSYVEKIACLNQKLYYHDSKELTAQDIEQVYKCPVELIAHGVPHRIMKEHSDD
jgi:zinc transport system ATP-binding protein